MYKRLSPIYLVTIALILAILACRAIVPAPIPTSVLNNMPGLTSTNTPILTDTSVPPTETLTLLPLPGLEITDAKGVSMRLVPEGVFKMGSDNGNSDEQPFHEVYLDAFYMDKYEVTNFLYKACVNAGMCNPINSWNRHYNDPKYENHPVVYMDWNEAQTYCEWRGAQLPTEAQWEKAARGTDGRAYPWGEEIDCSKANYYTSDACVGDTTAVGSYESGKSPYGIYDMAGNVDEWVADWYQDTYYQNSPFKNPLGPSSGSLRVLRGGPWDGSANYVRSSLRNGGAPSGAGYILVGFRCARSTP